MYCTFREIEDQYVPYMFSSFEFGGDTPKKDWLVRCKIPVTKLVENERAGAKFLILFLSMLRAEMDTA